MPPIFQAMGATFVRSVRSLTLTDEGGYFDFDFDGVPEPRIFYLHWRAGFMTTWTRVSLNSPRAAGSLSLAGPSRCTLLG